MNESKRKRIKRAAVSWLCVAALAASAVPAELTGIITPISVFAASEPDPIDFVGTIDLSKLMDYKSSPDSCPAGITASLVDNSSNAYDRSVVLTISQNGSYKLIGSNCINGSYVDVQIKITNNAVVTLVCDDAYIKNDNGTYVETFGCGDGGRDYVKPFKAEDGSRLTVSGKLYVDTYSYPYGYYSSPLYEGNVTLSSFDVYCYYPDRANDWEYDLNYALSGSEYDLRDYTPKYKCLINYPSGSRIGKITSEARVNFFEEHDLNENHKCNRCGIYTHTITYVIDSASQNTKTVDDQSLLKKPAVPTNGTNTFTGWYTDESCTTLYDFSTPVTGDLTLYAGWFTPVLFNGVTYDKPLNKNTVKYFYTDNSGNIVLDTGNYILTEDMVFDNDISLKAGSNVNLFLNGHELAAGIDSSSAAGFVIVNDENTPGKLLTKTDSADNWTLPNDYIISDNTDSATKITFPYALCHTRVDFEMNGHGTQIDSLEPTNKAVTKPEDPTESGWTFGGWYSDADLKTPFDFDNITDICTAYAQWTEYAVEEIAVKTPPKKTEYFVGESFDPAGLVLTITYDNGETADVAYSAENASKFKFSPDGALALTDTSVAITYGGKTVTVAVTVNKGEVKIETSDDNVGGAVIDMPIDELLDAILDDEDIELIAQGVNISVLMATVTIDPEIVPETDKQAIDDVLNDFSIGCYLDVNLFKRYSNGDPDKPVTDPSAAITISFEVPQYILDKYPKDEYVYSIFCSHNGVGYPVESRYDADTNIMTFSSDKFSIYALGVMPEEVEEEYNIKSDSHIKVVNSAKEGETVTVIVDEGYKAVVTDENGKVIAEITGTGTFTMPASDVTITAEKISKPDPVKYYSIYTDSHVWVDSTKHKEGDTVNYRVDNFYEAVLYVNGTASSKLSGSGSFTMPAADVRIVSGMDEITYAMFTTSVENSYVYSYDTDMNLIKTSGTRKKNNYIIIDLGEEYAGRSITIYKGRKSTKTIITEGVLDKNGIFKFENAGFGTNYTLIIGD
ncbi:MAG: InlB B-repeat-containing protein [Oscillospiraceae bacterium]|nr:InlB B-repeat-containing protein [Oscillospiraceae bacterium]